MTSPPSARAGTMRWRPRGPDGPPTFDAEEIARKAMAIAADICVYTNGNLTVDALQWIGPDRSESAAVAAGV
jgi:hypothetical protein